MKPFIMLFTAHTAQLEQLSVSENGVYDFFDSLSVRYVSGM